MSQPFVGEIRMFAGNFAINGWAFCNGQLLPIDQYTTLFTLIGTTYGGDGQTTFALPDLQGRAPMHTGSNHPIGERAGTETVTLTIAQLPAHSHPANASNNAGSTSTATNNFWAASSSNDAVYKSNSTGDATMNPQAVSAAGSSQAHDNMQPYLAVNFIISLFGIFPSQN